MDGELHFERHCTQARETRMEAVERALVFACTALVDGLSMAWLACDGFWFVDPIIFGVFVDAKTFHRRPVANLLLSGPPH